MGHFIPKHDIIYMQEKLFPGIYLHWKKYQERLITKIKSRGDLMLAGDGRHDSMGHSAKYYAYTVFCCTVPFILHFTLVQVCYKIYNTTVKN